MIGLLRGVIIKKQPPLLLIDVHGVGYEIESPMTTFYALPKTNDKVCLYTHLIVRDDAHLLFGFASEDERRLFRALIKVNGVGAKMALAILSGIETETFAACIKNNDAARLTKLPGIGKKTAERLIIEMRDRLGRLPAAPILNKTENEGVTDEAVSALIALGYKASEASRYVLAVADNAMNSEALIRAALKHSIKN